MIGLSWSLACTSVDELRKLFEVNGLTSFCWSCINSKLVSIPQDSQYLYGYVVSWCIWYHLCACFNISFDFWLWYFQLTVVYLQVHSALEFHHKLPFNFLRMAVSVFSPRDHKILLWIAHDSKRMASLLFGSYYICWILLYSNYSDCIEIMCLLK